MKKISLLFLCSTILLATYIFWYRDTYKFDTLIDQTASYILYPTLYIQSKLTDPIKQWYAYHVRYRNVSERMAHLVSECDELRAELIALHALYAYGESIQELSDFKRRYAYLERAPIVHILVRHCSPQEHYFLVDAGTRKGIQVGMVALYKNCLVGRVDKVYPWYSRVRLITDPACKVAVFCARTKACGIHQGLNDRYETELTHVSHLQEVFLDDLVLSSGEGLIFPQGYGIGKIASVGTNGLHHKVLIKPLIDVMALTYCILVAKSDIV